MADTVQLAHSPGSPLRREGHGHLQEQYLGRNDEQYDHRLGRDDRRRVPTPPSMGGSYVPPQYDDRCPYGDERRVLVDPGNLLGILLLDVNQPGVAELTPRRSEGHEDVRMVALYEGPRPEGELRSVDGN